LLQRDHASPHGGLHAHPVAIEPTIWQKLSPRRSRWPEVHKYDMQVVELEQRQAAKAEELRELHDREISAPAADADRLATWQLDGERGERPTPTLPEIREQIQQRQEEWAALTRATERVLAEKSSYVEKHRKRLLSDATREAREAQARYHETIDALAAARDELRAARQTELWSALYPDEHAGRDVADSLCGGRKTPLRKLGLEAPVHPDRVIEALHDDADWIRGAATEEQYAALHGAHSRSVRHVAHWVGTPEGQQWVRGEVKQIEQARRNQT
jgi:hypothetical protein